MTLRRLVIAVIAVLGLMLGLGIALDLSGYVAPTDPPPEHTIAGTFILVDDDTAANGCVGPSGGNWDEVRPGATVEVTSNGDWLGSAPLGEGRVTTFDGDAACEYAFSLGVRTAEVYTLAYPGGLRLDYTLEELGSRDWHVAPACCDIVPAP